ncbi:CCA tRNA nucleotidyltransferase [Minwuia sp.]|uniref:CCA tRNA nucleotidyltransferase n=1 Tax=Minwuia sp. TaxID=2493630 RepID=UPI003A9132BF
MTSPPWSRDTTLADIVAALSSAGATTRLVGGCVRDWLLDRPVGDLDLATTLAPRTAAKALKKQGFRVIPTGIDHGTITVAAAGEGYEITTLRKDVATDGRHATVAFSDDWTEDAARRDFTINALYADLDGTVHDPLGTGLSDIQARQLRFAGDPQERIREDYLRILRFFRFQSVLDVRASQAGLAACAAQREGLRGLSVERIWQEMRKLLAGPNRDAVIRVMRQTEILEVILPEARAAYAARFSALADPDPVLALAALLDHEDARPVAVRWKLSGADRKRLIAATAPLQTGGDPGPETLRKLAYRDGKVAVRDRLLLARADGAVVPDAQIAVLETWERPSFPLQGEDVLALDIPPGRQVGALLSAVEDWWIEKGFQPDRAACLTELHRLSTREENP